MSLRKDLSNGQCDDGEEGLEEHSGKGDEGCRSLSAVDNLWLKHLAHRVFILHGLRSILSDDSKSVE